MTEIQEWYELWDILSANLIAEWDTREHATAQLRSWIEGDFISVNDVSLTRATLETLDIPKFLGDISNE